MKPTVSRRTVLLGSTAATLLAVFPKQADARGSNDKEGTGDRGTILTRPILEFKLESTKLYKDPFWDVQLDALVRSPDGQEQRIPAFWSGGSEWRWRFSAHQSGIYRYQTIANDPGNQELHGVTGDFQIDEYSAGNPLWSQGTLQVSVNHRYLETTDGEPFLWLGDTWWMGLTDRLSWPNEFIQLTSDRRAKGFNVVQLVAGLYPDMDSFDPRGKNEAGFPWEANYQRINPSWWDLADQRIGYLVDSEIRPCIVGCWGYYLKKMGMKKMRAHWRTVIARWGASPVIWCLAGEGSMPWYLSNSRAEEQSALEKGWTDLARYVRQTDPFQRLITIHPSRSSRETIRDPAVLDMDMLQTGHGDYRSIPATLKQISNAVNQESVMPVK